MVQLRSVPLLRLRMAQSNRRSQSVLSHPIARNRFGYFVFLGGKDGDDGFASHGYPALHHGKWSNERFSSWLVVVVFSLSYLALRFPALSYPTLSISYHACHIPSLLSTHYIMSHHICIIIYLPYFHAIIASLCPARARYISTPWFATNMVVKCPNRSGTSLIRWKSSMDVNSKICCWRSRKEIYPQKRWEARGNWCIIMRKEGRNDETSE